MRSIAALLLVIPVTSDSGWHVLEFDAIAPHVVQFSETGLTIPVERSAAPIVYTLPAVSRVTSVHARGRVNGVLNVTADQQGRSGFDDYALRVGLVELGPRRPGFLQRRLVPAWMRRLMSLAPPDAGIAQVRFFNLGISTDQRGRERRHPSSTMLHERVVASPDASGAFTLDAVLEPPATVGAMWIAADGDDTGSSFVVTLERLVLG